MPWAASAGITASLKMPYCSSISAWAQCPTLDVAVGDAVLAGAHGLQQVGKAHFKEFVQVAGHNADVAQPLQRRHVVALGLGQHTAVELENRLFPVEQRLQKACTQFMNVT